MRYHNTVLSVFFLLLFAITPLAEAEIKIALVAPLTGFYSVKGKDMYNAALMAVNDINTSGGILKQKVELIAFDDRCIPELALEIAHKLAKAKIDIVTGHFCDESSIASSEIYAKNSILQISSTSWDPIFTERGLNNVFRFSPSLDAQARAICRYFERLKNEYNIAMVIDDSRFSQIIAEYIIQRSNNSNFSIKKTLHYRSGQTDFSAISQILSKENIKVLFVSGKNPNDIGRMASHIRKRRLDTLILTTDTVINFEFWKHAGNSGDGILAISTIDYAEMEFAKPIVHKLKAQGIEPHPFVLYTYASIQTIAKAIEQAGSTKLSAMRAQLMSGKPFNTIIGDFTFDSKGDVVGIDYNFYEGRRYKFALTNSRPPPPPPPPPP